MEYLQGHFTKDEVLKNCRFRYYIDNNGNKILYEQMISEKKIFKPSGFELVKNGTSKSELRFDYKSYETRNLDSSRRRAKKMIFDYLICNNFDGFITLTLDKNRIDRDDYCAVIKRLTNFLSNRVKRKGLKYIGVPEYHNKGGLHFHFATQNTADSFKLVDSGTVSVEGRKKPIKVSTADRLKIPDKDRHTVYNIDDWEIGFSTCIFTYGSRGKLATYFSKELNKDCQKRVAEDGNIEKIGGRWYFHGGDLNKPIVSYDDVDYDCVNRFSFDVDTVVGKFKVLRFDENGGLLKR